MRSVMDTMEDAVNSIEFPDCLHRLVIDWKHVSKPVEIQALQHGFETIHVTPNITPETRRDVVGRVSVRLSWRVRLNQGRSVGIW